MKEVKIYTIISDQLSPPIIGESFCTDMVRHSDYAELEAKCAALAAENAGLKEAAEFSTATDMWEELGGNMMRYLYQEWYAEKLKAALQTPATDAFLAEVRAEARNEGINYTASRLAAAFNHGFINKSLREVFDVTRMILSAKEELANEPHPIDGLSGEYAEKSLEEWAEQIRKGGSQ